jgi:hypothetical protein
VGSGVQGVFMTIPKRCDSPQRFCGYLHLAIYLSISSAVIVQHEGHHGIHLGHGARCLVQSKHVRSLHDAPDMLLTYFKGYQGYFQYHWTGYGLSSNLLATPKISGKLASN